MANADNPNARYDHGPNAAGCGRIPVQAVLNGTAPTGLGSDGVLDNSTLRVGFGAAGISKANHGPNVAGAPMGYSLPVLAPTVVSTVYEFPVGASVRTAFYNGSAAIKPTEYTISAWVKPQQTATYRTIAARTGSAVADPLDNVSFLLAQGPFFKGFVQDDGINPTVTGLVPVVPGVWIHVALTCLENGTLILYVSGAADGAPKAVGEIVKFGTRWWIAAATMALSTDYYAGRLADVAIWKKALSAAEVLALSAPVRDLPLTVQPGELVVYCPMSDVADGVPVSTDWLDLGGTGSQILFNEAISRSDTI